MYYNVDIQAYKSEVSNQLYNCLVYYAYSR